MAESYYTVYLAFTMIAQQEFNEIEIRRLIRKSAINFGGNARLKIFGRLNCRSGKRMKKVNRVFFKSIEEALNQNFRPCGHCMKLEYQLWKNESV